MEHEALLRRIDDLARRCEKANMLTASTFLTPSEQTAAAQYVKHMTGCRMVLSGGLPDCERKAAFFLPDYLAEEDFDPAQELRGVRIRAFYGTPEHRDYLGALLGLGVRREWIGDIWIREDTAWVFCLPSVADQLAGLEQAGRVSVKAEVIPVSEIPPPERRRRAASFTVQSPRFDAILAETFRLSRTQAVKVLQNMAGGSRLIGIISHVTELKQEIDNQLVVTKDDEGSHVRWQIS